VVAGDGGVECRVGVAPADVLACTALSSALPADHSASVDRPTLRIMNL
jgi:hypothetical protein